MNLNLKLFICLVVIGFSSSVKSQNVVHFLINKDAVTDCSMMKSGTFVNEETEDRITEGYTIEFTDKFVIEKVENGKYFLKSSIVFNSACSYTETVIETTIPGYESEIGTSVFTEILETSVKENLVKIRSKAPEEKWTELVFRKIK